MRGSGYYQLLRSSRSARNTSRAEGARGSAGTRARRPSIKAGSSRRKKLLSRRSSASVRIGAETGSWLAPRAFQAAASWFDGSTLSVKPRLFCR
jgi:hypothetical protein